MDNALLIAVISGLCTAVPCVISTFVTNNTREALQTERLNNMVQKIDELNEKVDRLSDFDKRISLLEQTVERLINDMKGEHYHE
jgi:hypothetical protein